MNDMTRECVTQYCYIRLFTHIKVLISGEKSRNYFCTVMYVDGILHDPLLHPEPLNICSHVTLFKNTHTRKVDKIFCIKHLRIMEQRECLTSKSEGTMTKHEIEMVRGRFVHGRWRIVQRTRNKSAPGIGRPLFRRLQCESSSIVYTGRGQSRASVK